MSRPSRLAPSCTRPRRPAAAAASSGRASLVACPPALVGPPPITFLLPFTLSPTTCPENHHFHHYCPPRPHRFPSNPRCTTCLLVARPLELLARQVSCALQIHAPRLPSPRPQPTAQLGKPASAVPAHTGLCDRSHRGRQQRIRLDPPRPPIARPLLTRNCSYQQSPSALPLRLAAALDNGRSTAARPSSPRPPLPSTAACWPIVSARTASPQTRQLLVAPHAAWTRRPCAPTQPASASSIPPVCDVTRRA